MFTSIANWFRRELRIISGLSSTANEKAYAATLAGRPGRDDDGFYEQFYVSTGVPKEIPIRLRKLLEQAIGDDLAALHPEDNLAITYDFVDFADVLYRIERVFDVRIPLDAVKFEALQDGLPRNGEGIDGTFDSVVRYLAKHCGK